MNKVNTNFLTLKDGTANRVTNNHKMCDRKYGLISCSYNWIETRKDGWSDEGLHQNDSIWGNGKSTKSTRHLSFKKAHK